jgi:hypothetical protein
VQQSAKSARLMAVGRPPPQPAFPDFVIVALARDPLNVAESAEHEYRMVAQDCPCREPMLNLSLMSFFKHTG